MFNKYVTIACLPAKHTTLPVSPRPGKGHNNGLPTDTLGVVIHRDRQFIASTQAAALEDGLSILCCHALSKTMDTQSTMNFGLISPLRHYTFLSIPE